MLFIIRIKLEETQLAVVYVVRLITETNACDSLKHIFVSISIYLYLNLTNNVETVSFFRENYAMLTAEFYLLTSVLLLE